MIAAQKLVLPIDEADAGLHEAKSMAALKKILKTMQPQAPPEAIATQALRLWPMLGGMHTDDVVAGWSPDATQLWLGEVLGAVGFDGHYTLPVRWMEKPVAAVRLGRYRKDLQRPQLFWEVTQPATRSILRDRMPGRAGRVATGERIILSF